MNRKRLQFTVNISSRYCSVIFTCDITNFFVVQSHLRNTEINDIYDVLEYVLIFK
jgi:hypothetical protein